MIRGRTHRTRGLGLLVLTLALFAISGVASARTAVRNVRYRGYVVSIPRSWPVYDLARDPHQCVRFDRHALYLGRPGADQECPAHAAGRTEAILLEPLADAPRAASGAAGTGAVPATDGHASTFVVRGAGVLVTATWARSEAVVEDALHRGSLPVITSAPASRARSAPRAAAAGPSAHAAAAVYQGLGFDACSAPSASQMSAWGSSPYRAIGVYIGGVNAACSQPNLTTSWVSTEVEDGWHLIPTYVGLQAPSNSCGCASMTAAQASADGAAAATDAVNDAVAIGIPAGNPIYDDMEAYNRTSTNTSAVLAFLSAWTSQLHADGYLSGVYSSAASGMTDLADQAGTSYVEPDDIWFADWNGEQTTSDSYIPASDWDANDRLHQYQGAHNETYGGVTINIDGDYLDGATADTTPGTIAAVQEPATPPALSLSPLANGTTDAYVSWTGSIGVTGWRVIGGFSPTTTELSTVAQASAKSSITQITLHNGSPYLAVQALGSGGQVLGSSPAIPLPPHITLFGSSTFAPATGGLGATPAGCYTGQGCHVRLTLSAGRTVLARTGSEYIAGGGGGMLYYTLTAKGRNLLARARGNRLAVTATARDSSGATATTKLNVIAFATSGPGPGRHLTQSPTARIISGLDYVSWGGTGGILAGCRNTIVCEISTTLKVGKTVVAQTGGEYLGANELGYLIFRLTARGRTLLRDAPGNQLVTQLTLTDGTARATGTVALIRFR